MNPASPRPKEVKLAVLLQMIVVISAWLPLLMMHRQSLALLISRSPVMSLMSLLPTVLIVGIVYAVYSGRNWARILYLGLWLLGLLTAIVHFALPDEGLSFIGSPMRVLFFAEQTGLSGIALVLLYSRASNIWFSPLSRIKEMTKGSDPQQC